MTDYARMASISLMLDSHTGFYSNTLSMLIDTSAGYLTQHILDSYPKSLPQWLFSKCDWASISGKKNSR